MTEIELGGYKFRGICRIIPELNEQGNPIIYTPQTEYNNILNLSLNKYGKGPFCKFHIPNGINEAGVYAVLVNNSLTYIGLCESLSPRWNAGYGNISPKNCFVKGQSTNCRLNNLILEEFEAKKTIELYFCRTESFCDVEEELIMRLNPEWNIKRATGYSVHRQPTRSIRNPRNKYQPLTDYLRNSQKSVEYLTYEDIEGILSFKLPNSAYQYRPWWANSGQSHSETWTNAGWRIVSVKLGESISFKKSQKNDHLKP